MRLCPLIRFPAIFNINTNPLQVSFKSKMKEFYHYALILLL